MNDKLKGRTNRGQSASERIGTPDEGQYFNFFIKSQRVLDPKRADKTREEAIRVVGKFAHPHATEETSSGQLVLGEVQSGKTSNMMATIALALDNHIPIVIVITGTVTILSSQTVRDIQRHLRFSSDESAGPFMNFIQDAGKAGSQIAPGQTKIPGLIMAQRWFENPAPDSKALCIFMLKKADVMRKFVEAIEKQPEAIRNLPVLIIDDEADQAGPDGSRRKRDKTTGTLTDPGPTETNKVISNIRDVFPRHNYVLYTATPQALLLSHLGNALSPDSVTVLNAGEGYVGVADLFPAAEKAEKEPELKYAIRLTDADVEAFRVPGSYPESLIEALAAFLVRGAVAKREPFSLTFVTMLIHTSQVKAPMEQTNKWVNSQLDEWQELFDEYSEREEGGGLDPDFKAIWSRYFVPAVASAKEDLGSQTSQLLSNETLLIEGMRELLSLRNVKIVNSDNENIEDNHWNQAWCWILIGGNKLGRGFRVENLIVTYMPRETKAADSALDTVQQRGRFFGYRRSYARLLKGWLAPKILATFNDYREHELDLRNLLKEVEEANLPLKQWKRVLRSPGNRTFTRSNVIKLIAGTVTYKPGAVAFTHEYLYFEGLKKKTDLLYANLLADCGSLKPASQIGSGGQLSRAATGQISFAQLEDFLLALYDAVSGTEAFTLSPLIDHLSQFHANEKVTPPSCQVVFHDYDLATKSQRVDKRGPYKGLFLRETTRISGLSSNNSAGQRPAFFNNLEQEVFILHVHLFDIFKVSVDSSRPADMFASAQAAFQLQVPSLPFSSTLIQN